MKFLASCGTAFVAFCLLASGFPLSAQTLSPSAAENFTAPNGTFLRNHTGGTGFATSWKDDSACTVDLPATEFYIQNNEMTTVNPILWGGASGQLIDFFRRLNTPLDLGIDQEYLATVRMTPRNFGGDTFQYLDFGGLFKVGYKRSTSVPSVIPLTTFNGTVWAANALTPNVPHTFVISITARASGNDTLRLKVFPDGGPAPTYNPSTWDIEVSAAKTGLINYVGLQFKNGSGSGTRPVFDELALGVPAPLGSPELRVQGNQVVLASSPATAVRLTGMNVPSLEWSNEGDAHRASTSAMVALDSWNSNIIRVPLSVARWYGCEIYQTSPDSYRAIVDSIVEAAASRGKYVILDCHWSNGGQGAIVASSGVKNTATVDRFNGQHKAPDLEVKDFWVNVATRYQNNPAVLFNIYNEPNGITWPIWRNGGTVTENIWDIAANASISKTYQAAGHQEIVEAIRDVGAKNLIVAGGLDWAYDLTGIAGLANGDTTIYALIDQGSGGDTTKTGHGIIYDAHIYPWKHQTTNWDLKVGCVRKIAPVIAGENGWDEADFGWANVNVLSDPKKRHPNWVPELLNWFDNPVSSTGINYGNQVHWTGWCFHPSSSPRILTNWNYEPSPYWGEYVKARLLSYPSSGGVPVGNYVNLFGPDAFIKYTLEKDGSGATLTKVNGTNAIILNFNRVAASTKCRVLMQPQAQWCFLGMQQLQFKLNPNTAAVGKVIRIGIEEPDGEIWTTTRTLQNAGVAGLIEIRLNELVRTNNIVRGDGVFNFLCRNIHLSFETAGSGSVVLSEFVLNRNGSNFPAGWPAQTPTSYATPTSAPYVPATNVNYAINFDAVTMPAYNKTLSNGDYMRAAVTTDGSGYNGTQAYRLSYKRSADQIGEYIFATVPANAGTLSTDARYLSFMMRGDGLTGTTGTRSTSMKIVTTNGGVGTIRISLMDDQWRQYTYELRQLGILGTESISRIEFYNDLAGFEGYHLIDDITFSSAVPNLDGAALVSEFANNFQTDSFAWSVGGSNSANDSFTIAASASGYSGSGKLLSFKQSGSLTHAWGIAALPVSWNTLTDAGYLGLMIRGNNPSGNTDRANLIEVSLKAGTTTVFTCDLPVAGDGWEQAVIPLVTVNGPVDLSQVDSIEFANVKYPFDGAVMIDDVKVSRSQPSLLAVPQITPVTSTRIVSHHDFQSGITIVNDTTSRKTVRQSNVIQWSAQKDTSAAFSSLFAITPVADAVSRRNYITTEPEDLNDPITLDQSQSKIVRFFHDLPAPLTAANGIITVEMRMKEPDYNNLTFFVCANPGGTTVTGNRYAARVTFLASGVFRTEAYVNGLLTNTNASLTMPEESWIHVRLKINLTTQQVEASHGTSPFNMKPWTAATTVFNFASTTAISQISSLAIEGFGTLSMDDIRVSYSN